MRRPPAQPGGDALDALRFARVPRVGSLAGLRAMLGALRRHPGQAAGILLARLSGRRLRASQALAALFGVDHRLRPRALPLPGPESTSVLARRGIVVTQNAMVPPVGEGAVLVLSGPGHALVSGAAEAIANAFATMPSLHAVYGDALVVLEPGGPPLPVLRPAFDPDYLRGVDYVGPVVAVRRATLDAIGPDLVPEAAVLDLLLRIGERFGREAIRHLPRVLSLWHPSGGGEGASSRAGRVEAVRRSLDRTGQGNAEVTLGADGVIACAYPLPRPRPLVSLIVPTRDRLDLLLPCIASLASRTDWADREILICDNDSREPATLAYFHHLEAEGIARIVHCPGPFNFAAMNNRAAEEARGRLLGFVNNDVEAYRPDWLELMAREALRPEIGAVGAKLLDGQGRIQHGGIVLGTGGLVTHGHRHFPGSTPGYLSALSATRAVSAVTAACLVVEAYKFHSVGRFDADVFAVDFNDVDLCLRLNRAGYRSLLVPSAVLHHREAASRRWTDAARTRHAAEVAHLKERWGPLLVQDPHYHPGFDPNLSTHARLRAGWTGREPAVPR